MSSNQDDMTDDLFGPSEEVDTTLEEIAPLEPIDLYIADLDKCAAEVLRELAEFDTDMADWFPEELPTTALVGSPTGPSTGRKRQLSNMFSFRADLADAQRLDSWIEREKKRTGRNQTQIILKALLDAAIASEEDAKQAA